MTLVDIRQAGTHSPANTAAASQSASALSLPGFPVLAVSLFIVNNKTMESQSGLPGQTKIFVITTMQLQRRYIEDLVYVYCAWTEAEALYIRGQPAA